MEETTQDIQKKQDVVFRDLLVDLKGHLNIPSLFPSFKTKMKTYLSEADLSTDDFLEICGALERGGHIAPRKMQILKDATQKLDFTAYRKIVIAGKKIYRLQKATIPVKVSTLNVEPSNQRQKLMDEVFTFFTQQIKLISQETDFETRETRMKEVNKDFGIFVQNFEKFGATLDHIEDGSLIFVFRYNSQTALKRLWALYTSGELLVMLKNGIFTTSILELCRVTSLNLDVYISEEEYEYCLKNAEEMTESEVMGNFEVPLDEESRNASRASEEKRHSGSEQSQEKSIQKQSTNQDITDEKVMSSIAITTSLEIPQTARGSNICPHHQGMEVLFVCQDCEGKLICAKCVAAIHTNHAMEAVSDVIQHAKGTIQDFVHKTENTHLPEIHEKVKRIGREICRNENHYTNVIATIKQQNENLKLELDKITDKMVSLCRECEKQNEDIIKNYNAELQSKIGELNARIKELKDILQTGTDTQIYETSREIPNDVTISDLPSLQNMDFNPSSILIDQLERSFGQLTNIGHKARSYVNDVTSDKSYRSADQQWSSNTCHNANTGNITDEDKETLGISTYKIPKDVIVKFKLFKTFKYLSGIFRIKAFSDKNQVWVGDGGGELALLTNTGQVQKTMEMDVGIEDFFMSPSTSEIWFCSYDDNKVRKVIGDNESTVMFHAESEPRSICISADGNILVGMERQIVKYTERGQILCESTQVKQVPVVRYPDSISQCPVTRKIAVADWDRKDCGGDGKKHVSILSEDLQLLCRYYGRDIESFWPWDVCYSDTGDIYIANYNNSSIQQISGTGEFRQTAYTDSDKTARRLCVHSNGDIWAVSGLEYVMILQKQ